MKNLKLWSSILTAGLIFTACGDNTTYSYKVSVQNLTYSQPLSPMAVSYHKSGEDLFAVGKAVSVGFENLAEGGSNTALLAELTANTNVYASVGGTGVILPSKTDTITIVSGVAPSCISVASMLVNTNDAFAGANCIDISALGVGKTIVTKVPAYDAGTEMNSETNGSIPGPVAGGEGFNATRDDTNFVFIHPNVVTKDDGLSTSVLTQAHKWDNPTATITVERI